MWEMRVINNRARAEEAMRQRQRARAEAAAKLKAEQADDTAALAAAETILEKSQDQLKQIHPGFAPKQPSSSSAPPLVMELSGPDGDKTPVKITSAEEMAERIDKMKMLGMS